MLEVATLKAEKLHSSIHVINLYKMSTNRKLQVIFLLAIALIGVVHPFAFGSTPDVNRVDHIRSQDLRQSLQTRNPLFQPSYSYVVAQTAIAERSSTATESPPRSRILQFASRLRSKKKEKTENVLNGGAKSASFPSRMFFSYVSPLLDLASRRTLSEEDAFEVPDNLSMDRSVESLATVYEEVRQEAQKKIESQRAMGDTKSKNPQSWFLLKALLKQERGTLVLTGALRLLNTGVQAFPAILVSRLLRTIEAGNAFPVSKAYTAAFMLVSVLSTKMLLENQYFHNVVSMSTKTRGSLEGLIFDKSLRLPNGGSGVMTKQRSKEEKKALGSGGVLNLMQTDASIIESAVMQIHTIWDGPLQIGMYTYLLYKYLGSSVLYGLAVLLTVIPLNSVTLRILDRMSRLENEARDARTKRTNESINNMKLLKLQGWEEQFAGDIRRHRADELAHHKMRGVIRSINSAISNAVPALVLVVTLTAYANTGRPIVASTVFTAISLFNQLRFPLFFYPMLIDALANGKNSLRRLSSYLTSEELTPYVVTTQSSEGGSIELKNGNFLWSTSDSSNEGEIPAAKTPALCNANLKVYPGEVIAVVGGVGTGKTALIKALLGELAPVPRMVVDRTFTKAGTESGIDCPSVTMNGNIAYCSQEAWLPKGTIREAIVFGRDFDERRYRAAVYDAGLDKDMDPIAGSLSDLTDVGEGGSSLSGGQRARVALARALYSDEQTKVFLLDDCLAALDATVGSLVFERITKRIKDTKITAVLVTNDPSLPRRCDRVILMGSSDVQREHESSTCSTILDMGTYDALLKRGHQLQRISSADTESHDEALTPTTRNESSNNFESPPAVAARVITRASNTPHMVRVTGGYRVNATCIEPGHADPDRAEIDCRNCPDSMADRALRGVSESAEEETENYLEKNRYGRENDESLNETSAERLKTLSTDDSMSTEPVPFSTYIGYLRAVRSPMLMGAMIAAFVTTNAAQFYQQYTVAKWTEVARGDSMASALGGTYLQSLVYAAGVVSVFLWLRSYFTMLVGARASSFYHDRMVSSVFQAPMSFFDATPSGQIMSRFGKEIGTVDRALPDSFASVLFCVLQIGSSALALAGAITPVMLIPMLFAGSLYFRTMKRFRPAARDMQRSETKTRSPIFTHFGEALRGTEIIRSIPSAKKTWSREHRRLSDRNISVFSTVKALDRWLSISLEFLGNSMVFTTAIACVVLTRSGELKPGAAGWGLTQSLAITGLMAWAVRNLTMLESHMMSVTRVRELTDLDLEEADTTKVPKVASAMPREFKGVGEALEPTFPSDKKPKIRVAPTKDKSLRVGGWPWKGDVVFKNVSMRYSPVTPFVLKNVTIRIPPGSTLGVVGRTGSGKSSLLLTLFRIVEIETSGSIEIDGVDIRSISIQTLRESLSIIPQDPVMFEGTLAYNLDATGKASVSDMWEALNAASPDLAKQFRDSGGLDSPISEGGGNLSQGQRQLICLARALLRKSKILVMDEATSSVDATTDQQVQATIRREFVDKGVSVITVAHRLDTVLKYDNIAVLGDGALLEYGKPFDLLRIRDGELKQLVLADRQNKMKGGNVADAIAV